MTDTCTLVTITNTGTAALTISKTAASGDFKVGDSSCGSRVAQGAACQIVVTFSPSAAGSRVSRLTVTDNAADSPQSIPLSGRGIAVSTAAPTIAPTPVPAIRIDPVTCTDTIVGSTSTCSLTTLTNTSGATLPITGLSATGEFAIQNSSCATPLAPGAPCQVVVTFTPTGLDARVGSLTVTFGGSGSPRTVPLNGKGIAPAVSIIPTNLTCPDTHVAQTATCQAVMTNTGTAVLTITSVTLTSATGGFTIPNNACGTTLGPGTTCQIVVTFTPPINGTYTGVLTVNDNAAGSPHMVQVTGAGVGGVPTVSLVPPTVSCGSVNVGTTTQVPCSSPITLTNTGSAALTITDSIKVMTAAPGTAGATVSPDFTVANQCGPSMAAGEKCVISITFLPKSGSGPLVTDRTAYVTVTDNAGGVPGSQQAVQVTGKATA